MKKHPLPYIEELKDLFSVGSFSDILRLNDFVYSLVPSVFPPYDRSGQEESFPELCDKLKKKEIGGWCSLNTVVLNRILEAYGIKSEFLNYGLPDQSLTHMVLLVHYSGQKVLIDPFLNKHYRNAKGELLNYTQLIMKLINREFNDIVSIYGTSRKPAKYIPDPLDRNDPNIFQHWVNYYPRVFEGKVMNKFRAAGLDEFLQVFRSGDPLFLMLFPLR